MQWCQNLLGFSSYQPQVCFPRNKKGRAFQGKWYHDFKWLEYSPYLDKAFCFHCRLFGQTGLLVHSSTKASKSGKMLYRSFVKSVAHVLATQTWQTTIEVRSNPNKDVCFQINEQHRAEVSRNRRYMKVIMETLAFLARQRLGFRGHRGNEDSMNKGNFWSFYICDQKTMQK